MKSLLLIGTFLFLLIFSAYGELIVPEIKVLMLSRCHMCHDPFIPRNHLILVPEADLVRIEKEGEFRIYIENTFRTTLREVELFVKNPAFDIEIKPPLLKKLMPGERTFFLIKLNLREGFKPGDYPLRISAGAKSAVLRPSIETIEVVSEPPVQPIPEAVVSEVEYEVDPPKQVAPVPEVAVTEIEHEVNLPKPVVPPEKEILKQEVIVEPLEEMVEPQAEVAGEIVVRVEEFIPGWYLYLIPILLLIGLLLWRKRKHR